MGHCFKIAVAVFCGLANAQTAIACGGNVPLTKIDVAFAEVIFEGGIREVRADVADRSSELVFDVYNVVRGDLPQKSVTVVLQGGFAYSAPSSIDDFVKRYGDKSRIALTTPQQVDKFCRSKMISSISGGVRSMKPFYRCDYTLLSLSPKAKDVPFVLRRTCGEPYLFDVDSYENMINYDRNVKVFEQQPRHMQSAELFKEITGATGYLPWEYSHRGHSQKVIIQLYRDNRYLFTSRLKEDLAALDNLVSQGREMIKTDKTFYPKSSSRDENIKFFEKKLRYEILKIATIIEKDPEFGERLLETY